MNIRRFKNSFLTFFFFAALVVAWLADNSPSQYEQRMTLLIGVLLLMLCVALAYLMSMPSQVKQQRMQSVLTPEQRKNAALFRHQPTSANFRVRMAHNEQARRNANARKHYAVNPDHAAFK